MQNLGTNVKGQSDLFDKKPNTKMSDMINAGISRDNAHKDRDVDLTGQVPLLGD